MIYVLKCSQYDIIHLLMYKTFLGYNMSVNSSYFCKLYCYVLLCSKCMKNDENKIKEKTLCFHLNQYSATTETTGTRFTKLP